MATIWHTTMMEGRIKFCGPGVKFKWNIKIFRVIGARTTKAKGARKPISKRNPQVVSVILRKARK